MTLDRVMVPIVRSEREDIERVVSKTVAVVESIDPTVFLVYLFADREYEAYLDEMDIQPTSGVIPPDELAARHDTVRTPASMLSANDIEYEIRGVAGGEPAEQVIKRAEELNADIVVVGQSDRTPTGKAVFGDRGQQILLNASMPVLYV
jgi:nucleotide-binding universal stress UspA family protein